MRLLSSNEFDLVSGGEGSEFVFEFDDAPDTRQKNNNGYGNGAESGPPPGNSGAHNLQLTGWNSGPRGPR